MRTACSCANSIPGIRISISASGTIELKDDDDVDRTDGWAEGKGLEIDVGLKVGDVGLAVGDAVVGAAEGSMIDAVGKTVNESVGKPLDVVVNSVWDFVEEEGTERASHTSSYEG